MVNISNTDQNKIITWEVRDRHKTIPSKCHQLNFSWREKHHHPAMNHLSVPPSWRSCQGSIVLNWSMNWVFDTLFHDFFTIIGILLFGFFHFPRSYLKKPVFISHNDYPYKIFPLSTSRLLCLMDLYLPSIRWISNPSKLI